jgi:solute carrier family 12 sodium/potassium/chloride transporter 2
MYIIGFCEALIDMLKQYVQDYTNITGSMINDVRMIGCITLVLILGLAIVGMDWVTKVSLNLFE